MGWHLQRIPKKAFFYWGNDKLPYLRMMSVVSFHLLNPDWEVYFYYPAVKFQGKNTWNTGEQSQEFTGQDYYSYFRDNYPKINKICFDFRTIGISNSIPEVFKSDFLRWHLLSEHGGLWSDIDILYFNPITDLKINTPDNAGKDTFICLNHGYHSIGFLLSSQRNNFFTKIYQYSKSSFSIKDYQSAGSHIFRKQNLNTWDNIKSATVSNIEMDAVYPIDSNNIDTIFNKDISDSIYNRSIGIHWFGGSRISNDYVNSVNEANYQNYHNTISGCLNFFYTGKSPAKMKNNFKIITTFYNANEWIGNCIRSVINQTYGNWKMHIVNDCSTDGSHKEIESIISNSEVKDKIKYVVNEKRVGTGLVNMIAAIKQTATDPNDIIVILDGDDWLASNDVLEYLNEVYCDPNIWMTYGSFEPLSGKYSNTCKQVEDTRTYRKSGKWTTSHLRSYRKWLWDKIKDDSFRNKNGDYISSADDCAAMFAMIEMSGLKHSKFIDKVLYVYNDLNPLNVMKINENYQLSNAEYIRSQKEYQEIDRISLSILITTFNRTDLLKYDLISLSEQGLKKYDYEIIILDEGIESEDIHNLINSFKDCLNIIYINTAATKKNQDDWRIPGYAFNIGAKKAKGEYILLMCAEMLSFNKNNIDVMISTLMSNDRALAIPSFAKDDDGSVLEKMKSGKTFSKDALIKLNNLRIELPFYLGMKKSEYLDINGYDEDLTGIAYDDDDIVSRLIANGCKYMKYEGAVVHLWHERKWNCSFDKLPEEIKKLINHNKNIYETRKGVIKRNVNKEWGALKPMSDNPVNLCPKYPNDIKITMMITSCKRYNLLEQTLNSFFDCCLDHDFIKEIILIDDNSDKEDVSKIIQLLMKINKPYIVVHKSSHTKGHANSLNYYFDLIKTDYIFHAEDDWLFTIKDNLISKAFFVMDEYPEIKEVVYRIGTNMAKNQTVIKTKNGIDYIKYNYENNQVRDNLDRPAWTGWNLNPSVQKWSDIKTLGKFNPNVSGVEYEFSRRYLKAGFKIAYFTQDHCKHLGDNNSSYTLNNTPK